jgi:hypothetical protein
MSETATETPVSEDVNGNGKSNYRTNLEAVLHLLVDNSAFRSEFETTMIHTALGNLDNDPTTLFQMPDPTTASTPATDARVDALIAQNNQLSAQLAEAIAAMQAATPSAPEPASGNTGSGGTTVTT